MPTLQHCSEIKYFITRCFSILKVHASNNDDWSKIHALENKLVSFVDGYNEIENKQVSTLLAKHIKLALYENIKAIKDTVKSEIQPLDALHVYLYLETIKKFLKQEGEDTHPYLFDFENQKKGIFLNPILKTIKYYLSMNDLSMFELLLASEGYLYKKILASDIKENEQMTQHKMFNQNIQSYLDDNPLPNM
jgi:hypothetical protein